MAPLIFINQNNHLVWEGLFVLMIWNGIFNFQLFFSKYNFFKLLKINYIKWTFNKIEKTLLSYNLFLKFCPKKKKKTARANTVHSFIQSSPRPGEREREGQDNTSTSTTTTQLLQPEISHSSNKHWL